MKAKKREAPAVTTAGAGAAAAAEQPPPVGTSWYWGSYAAAHGQAAAEEVPVNVDGAALQPLYHHLPFSFRQSRWSEEEQQRLRDGVLQLVQVPPGTAWGWACLDLSPCLRGCWAVWGLLAAPRFRAGCSGAAWPSTPSAVCRSCSCRR